LRSDEFITSFTLVFGTVNAGFTHVTQPQVFVTVNSNLPNGMEFANRVDIGGKYGSEWVIGNATAVTKIYAQPSRMPRTGF
jgi:predicted oxidoreductase